MNDLFTKATPRVVLVPRDYQRKAHDESFRLWETELGVLDRIFTGGGKTATACMKIKTWLERGDDHSAMIVSYERDLVWQFAQEVYDFLGIDPGIEMGDEHVSENSMPRIIVASRASLLPANRITAEQAFSLAQYGFKDCEFLPERVAKRVLKYLAKRGDMDRVEDEIARLRHANDGAANWSRLNKFDWRKNWLVVFDEAHRHAKSLKSVGHIVDWFDQNPKSRRSGLTATPKRGDGISIGHKMFPAVSIDYPLFHLEKPCAVKQGWAVPYVQKYIEVEGVDFKHVKKVAGDFDEAELERILGEEGCLAKLIEPLLDMVGDRRTLIFNPGVDMAKSVALYINARCQAKCPECQQKSWQPVKLIGDGAQCKCGHLFSADEVTKTGEQARSINGATNPNDRKQTYVAHQGGKFQFLSVCGLCREGYNDPDISCVAVFRPVSKKASSLAEQMKGRGCRPCRAIIPTLNELLTPEERVEAIATSVKPNCLIVDLVGVTGLPDCASTVQIYADGLEDEVADLAEELLAEKEEEASVADVVAEAKKMIAEEREKERAKREEEERQKRERAKARARAGASVSYSEHDVGVGASHDPNRASDGQYNLIALLGMKIDCHITMRKAGRIINMLKARVPAEQVAHQNGLPAEGWEPKGPSDKQVWKLGQIGVHPDVAKTGWDASQIIGAKVNPQEFEQRKLSEIKGCADGDQLTSVGKDVVLAKRVLPADVYQRLVDAGKAKRAALVE